MLFTAKIKKLASANVHYHIMTPVCVLSGLLGESERTETRAHQGTNIVLLKIKDFSECLVYKYTHETDVE